MSFNFTVKEFLLGNGNGTPTLQFYKRGFELNGNGTSPSWQDIILSGNTALTLVNSKANGLNYVKLFGKCEQRNLPSEYTQLKKLSISNGAYFDTGLVINKFDAQVKLIAGNMTGNATTTVPAMMWGFMGATGSLPRWGLGIYRDNWLQSANSTIATVSYDSETHIFLAEVYQDDNKPKWKSSIDGTETDSGTITTGTSPWETNQLSIFIGARNNNGSAGNEVSGDFTLLEVTQSGVLIGYIVPVKRNSDNTLGLYNTVTNQFLPDLGNGTLTAGADAVPTPDYPMNIVSNNGVLKLSPNLFNKDLVPYVNEYINMSNGNATSPKSGEFRHSDFIVIKENTQYYVGIMNSIAASAGLAFYDDTQTYISGMSLTVLSNNNNIITSPADTKYIRFSFRIDEGYDTDWQNTVYFVEGNQPLPEFIPYGAIYADGTQETITVDTTEDTATAEMLLGLDQYKDEQNITTGDITRNIGIAVFDGTGTWSKSDSYPNMYTTRTVITNRDYKARAALATHFINTERTADLNAPGYMFLGLSTQTINFSVSEDIDTTAKFKKWLADQYAAGTPVIVAYPTNSPVTETVTPQPLSIQAGTNVVEITQASIDNLPLEVSYKAGVTVTITEIENAQLDNSVTVTVS